MKRAKFHTMLYLTFYFYGYDTEFFSYQNNHKDLDPSYKMDPDLLDCLGKVKIILLQNFIRLI